MDSERQSFVSSLFSKLDRLRGLSQIDIKSGWRVCNEDISPNSEIEGDDRLWDQPNFDDRGYLIWERGRKVVWLEQSLVIPHHLHNYPLAGLICRLGLTWWAEDAQIFVNGDLVGAGDLFDSSNRILLSPSVIPDTVFHLRLRLVSPGHDIGAIMRSLVIFESQDSQLPEPGWIADELAVMVKQVATFQPDFLADISAIIEKINYDLVSTDRTIFVNHLISIKEQLNSFILPRKSKINLLGHAHLDMAWLWEVEETWEVAERTFRSALNLQQNFSSLTFCHSTPALYQWIEENRPDLFEQIHDRVNDGNWEIVGGMWIEPDLNLLSGESIARQIIYGQAYTRSRFNQLTKVAWLPDTFGFCWQLPQLLRQGKIDYFVTQKFLWNDTTQFPHQLFWWESPDGSRVLSWMSSPIGEGIDPLKMADYHYRWQTATDIDESLWLFGVGDHGGGPTRDMLELAKRWSQSDVFPALEFTSAVNYLDRLAGSNNSQSLPIWRDELYLEFHRGCYTTHAEQKRSNRQAEDLLYQAELWSSLVSMINHKPVLPATQQQIEQAWKYTLFNQFHDIIPGTSITPVYDRANREWEIVEQITTQMIGKAIEQISDRICLPTPPDDLSLPILIFNALNWSRQEVINLPLPDDRDWTIYDVDGNSIPTQRSGSNLLFVAANLPSVGYHLFWLSPAGEAISESNAPLSSPPTAPANSLENDYLRVELNPLTGDIQQIWDKKYHREVCTPAGANHLQAFTDRGQYWDAWNIDPNYREHSLPESQLKSMTAIETGAIRQRIRVVRKLAGCEFSQDYILDAHSPILKIKTIVDWQTEQVLVKVNFPLNLNADFATYEIACGAIERTTKPETPAETAKWEVPALRWADLTDNTANYGVSLLNDCKYGYDAGSDYLRLTLLRSPNWPDPTADRGDHEFTYAIYPHSGTWQAAETVKKGYELNSPLQVLQVSSSRPEFGVLPPVASLLDLGAENLVVMAVKPSETNPQDWILRCYECHGEATALKLKTPFNLHLDRVVNLLEEMQESTAIESSIINPWEIRTHILTQVPDRDRSSVDI